MSKSVSGEPKSFHLPRASPKMARSVAHTIQIASSPPPPSPVPPGGLGGRGIPPWGEGGRGGGGGKGGGGRGGGRSMAQRRNEC
jgi:hypothetical protein